MTNKESIELLREVLAWIDALPVPTSGAVTQGRKVDKVMQALAAAAPVVAPDDAARLDYIDRWRLRGVAAGYKWDSFHVLADKPIREQLDELIAKGK